MDTKNEDKMVRQIEKSLSNNINENLFLNGRIFEKENKQSSGNSVFDAKESTPSSGDFHQNSVASIDYINSSPTLSRAEYIRQARESCLRQLSSMQNSSRDYDSYYPEVEPQSMEILNRKKTKAMKLFQDGTLEEASNKEVNTPQELASFRFLILRTVCAIVLFLCIFIFDKFDFKIGGLTPNVIQEYVTGNDTFKELENILVTWLD